MAQAAKTQSPNFASVLDQQSSSIERPRPYPVGTYTAVVKGLPRLDKNKNQKEFSEYVLAFLAASEDVDEDDLKEVGGISGKTIKTKYYHTEESKWRLKKFFDDLGIPEQEDDEELTLRQRMQMVPGRQVLISIKHTPSEDGSTIYANVDGTAAVE